jgi:HSP20 family protein
MANVTRYDPFSELVDDLFRGFVVRPVGNSLARVKVDVAESNGAYTVNADLPGVRKEDIQVSIDGNEVTLVAEAKREKEASKDERVLHAERVYGKVSRSFTRPRRKPSSATACSSSSCRRRLPRRASRSRSSKAFPQFSVVSGGA